MSTESAGTRHPIFAVIGQKKMAAAKIGGESGYIKIETNILFLR